MSRSGARLRRDVVAPAFCEARQEAWSWAPDGKSTEYIVKDVSEKRLAAADLVCDASCGAFLAGRCCMVTADL